MELGLQGAFEAFVDCEGGDGVGRGGVGGGWVGVGVGVRVEGRDGGAGRRTQVEVVVFVVWAAGAEVETEGGREGAEVTRLRCWGGRGVGFGHDGRDLMLVDGGDEVGEEGRNRVSLKKELDLIGSAM